MRTQRSRWEGGRLAALISEGPQIANQVWLGKYRLLEPLLDLLLLPLALHSVAILLLFFLPFPLVHVYAYAALGTVIFYCCAAMCLRGSGWKDWAALCMAPLYILWKLSLIPSIVSAAKKSEWKKTERDR
jgi:hypothetical protein